MKKCILIIMLCSLQGACASYDHSRLGSQPLLSYEELGSQITVTRIAIEAGFEEPADEAVDLEDVVAAAP